jgi:endonuclease-8
MLDQTLVAGIGNMWMAEALWRARLSPWRRLRSVAEDERRLALETAAALMRAAVDAGREPRKQIYGRAGRPCARCRTSIKAWGQGDANRTAYWCPVCQVGDDPPAA